MKKEDFLSELEEVLELDGLTENSELLLSSLNILSIIAFIDENFDKQFKAVEIKNIKSVSDLIKLIGEDLN